MPALPYVNFYCSDWLGDTKVRRMGREGRGVHIDMLCHAWQDEAGLPSDLNDLGELLGVPVRELKRLWPKVEVCWTEVGGALFNARLETERGKQKGKQKAGKTGGETKANGQAKPKQNASRTPSKTEASEIRDQKPEEEEKPFSPDRFFEDKAAADKSQLEAKERDGTLNELEQHSLRGYREEEAMGLR